MNQYIKTFEEFKEIYINEEVQKELKKAVKIKKRYRKFVICMSTCGILSVFCMLFTPVVGFLMGIGVGIAVLIIGIIIVSAIFGKSKIVNYPDYYRSTMPQLIGKHSNIEVKTTAVNDEEFFGDDYENMSTSEKIKDGLNGKRLQEYDKKVRANLKEMYNRNTKQFKNAKIVEADEYSTSNIAQFIHKDTDTIIDFYYAAALNIDERTYTRYIKEETKGFERKYGKKYKTREEKYTKKEVKVVTSGAVLTMEKLHNIKLDGFRILVKDDDKLLSHLTENTIESMKVDNEQIKFNRIDLNKAFDCFVYGENGKDKKVEALEILTPTVEDLFAYIWKKYGRYNLAINNNKIDIQFVDTGIIGGSKQHYKDVIIKPKLFSNKDLKISYLYRFYELIEIQKLILKYLNCYPEKYLITEEDVQGLREAIESKKLSNYEMDKSVEMYFDNIVGG